MLKPILASLVFAFASAAPGSAQGYGYGPTVVTLKGTLTSLTGEEPNGKRVKVPALKLAQPITVEGTPGDDMEETERDVVLLQVVALDRKLGDQVKRFKGKRVAIRGTLMHQHTGHHHSAVLILPDDIRAD
jgi:hypothetical protein